MLTQTQVRRYSAQSGLRDMMIAEKEVVLTFLLQLLSERGILDRLAFKGGTSLRKMFIRGQGRFSTDLDFTGLEERDHEDHSRHDGGVRTGMRESAPIASEASGFSRT
jgi:predicted nucleotidyltransferase component of viral defense system